MTLPEPLSFTARPHHDAVLNEAETLAELTPNETTEIHIDAAMRGLGTAACGPDALPQFLIGPFACFVQKQWPRARLAAIIICRRAPNTGGDGGCENRRAVGEHLTTVKRERHRRRFA